ncbi:hypothetical protein [Glycomyces harbinensis]|uniref:Uncharacterized protein n=1 Tax=Glycomyces harbinensis TaxID=58114 RepID=A0A1G6V979_9ACTN|nr:hypothetical protein [Glycomyces harbinensis]SDD49953.1 hypothetical protein SAMN05216270_104280 [Glycomyces harbinensis]
MSMRFNDHGVLEVPEEYDDTLGTFLVLDIGDDPYKCLVGLYCVAQIEQGRSRREVVGGESVAVELTPDHAILEDHFDPSRSKSIPFAQFKSALEALWAVVCRANGEPRPSRVYRPDLAPAEGDLLLWEETFGRRHPYRGAIEGIPARGPE